jgi:hypothetical protein
MTDALTPSEPGSDDEAYTVRPYAVTGGRVSDADSDLPMEALVRSSAEEKTLKGLTPEKKRILLLSAGEYQSVAELSAHTRLPLGVVRVLVTDLAASSYLTIHTAGTSSDPQTHDESGAISLSLLESVLDGIAAL